MWLQAIRRVNFPPATGLRSHHRVCSDHFVSGEKHDDLEHIDYVPTVFKFSTRHSSVALDRYKRLKRRHFVQQAGQAKRLQDEAAREEATSTLLTLAAGEPRFSDKETSTDADPLVTLLQKENKQLKEKIATLRKQLAGHQQHATQKFPEVKQFGFEHIKLQSKRDVYTRHYTGVPTFEVLQWLCDMLASKMPESGASLSAVDRVLLILMKLKLSATNSELSIRFGVSEQTVSVIIRTHIDVIAAAVGFLVPWPDREAIVMHMPSQCKKNFHKLRIIIDCTEVFIERSKNLLARAQTYSNYKHHNTIKFLVGISPSGAFTYISKAWGGRASDKQITLADGLLDKLDHGDMVMSDRGFLIEEELAVRGVTLAIPAFTKGKKQFSRKDVEKSRQMLRFRIHVERAIRRLKVYKIMST